MKTNKQERMGAWVGFEWASNNFWISFYFHNSYLKSKYRDYQNKKQNLYETNEEPRWVTDYEGEMQTKFSLFWQYLEIGKY